MPKFFTHAEGGPALLDAAVFTTGDWSDPIDLTADASYDLGSAPTIPATATAVILRFYNTHTTNEYGIGARHPDSTTDRHDDLADTVNTAQQAQAIPGINSNGEVEIYIESTDVLVYVIGYLESEAALYSDVNQYTFNVSSTGVWEKIDLSAHLSDPDTKFAIIEYSRLAATLGFNFRYPDSADNRVPTHSMSHGWYVVPVNGSGQIEVYSESNAQNFVLVGEIKANATVKTTSSDVSTGTTGSYTPIDVSALSPPANTVMAVLEANSTYSSGFRQMGVRPFGDTSYTDLYSDTICYVSSQWWLVPITKDAGDSNKEKFDAKIESTNVDFYVWGWIEETTGTGTINLSASIVGASSTPSVDFTVSRSLSSSIQGASSLPSVSFTVARSLAASILGASTTPSASFTVLRALIASILGASSTPDDVVANTTVIRQLIASIIGASSTPEIDAFLVSVIDQYAGSNDTYYALYSGSLSYGGQTFAASNNYILHSLDAYVGKINSPTGTMQAEIYAHTGTYGNGGPTGSPLAVSNVLDVASNYGDVQFEFSGANRINLVSGTKYCWLIKFTSTFSDATNYLYIRIDSTSPTHGGNAFSSAGNDSGYDLWTWAINGQLPDVFNLVASISGISSTPSINFTLARNLVASILGASSTPSINYSIARNLIADILGASSTPGAGFTVARNLIADILVASSTPSVGFTSLRNLIASLLGESSTPDDVAWRFIGLVNLFANIIGASSTPIIDVVTERALAANIIGASSTPTVSYDLSRGLSAGILGMSSTPSINFTVLRLIVASILASSSTPDDVIALIQEALLAYMINPSTIDNTPVWATIDAAPVWATLKSTPIFDTHGATPAFNTEEP